MKIKSLDNITKKESYLYYRNEYNADAVFIYGNSSKEEAVPVSFVVERTAAGIPVISTKILKHINYPMLGASAQLKKLITELESKGELP